MLGHASATMTLDVYADLFPDDLDSVAAALDLAAQRHLLTRDDPANPILSTNPTRVVGLGI